MRPFALHSVTGKKEAIAALLRGGNARYLAGGTTLVDLMKLGVERPDTVVEINRIKGMAAVDVDEDGILRIGALARMSDVADDARVKAQWPMISQSLWKAASAQLRNMASIGGNLLQRTRCAYFRDTAFEHCNKRAPGSGCDAINGHNRENALLGTSPHCIALHPSDLCVALMALNARVETLSGQGQRTIDFEELHRLPGNTPHIENSLRAGELITAIIVPPSAAARRSLYVKIRDRQSYQFAVTSVAAGVELAADGAILDVRLALGGVATKAWRATEAERYLVGRHIEEATVLEAGKLAMEGAQPRTHNAFKVELMRRTVADAMLQLAAMELGR